MVSKDYKTAQDFSLPDQNGNQFTLSKRIDKYLLLVFYPKDGTLVCTQQLCSYNNDFKIFSDSEIDIAAISIDSVESHKKFSDKFNFQFPLLSDVKKEVSKQFDALSFIGLNKRKLVLVDKSLKIIYEKTVMSFFYEDTDKIIAEVKMLLKNNIN